MKILIVDDDPIIQHMLDVGLRQFGHEIIKQRDGEAAWNYLQDNPVRLIITDWIMPKLDGLELIKRIRSSGSPDYSYIIILSGREDTNDIVAGLESGADDYLVKPFDINELRARVGIGLRILELESNLKNAMEKMETMAMQDYLTKLLNRRAIYTHLQGEINRSVREKTPLSVLLLDVDHFKQINDTYGHITGDMALVAASEAIRYGVRAYDWTGRWGGDEFIMILPGAESKEAEEIANRIMEKIKNSSIEAASGEVFHLEVSIGVLSQIGKQDSSIEELIQQVDEALYQAKKTGRGRIILL